jgi:hypothetical protein
MINLLAKITQLKARLAGMGVQRIAIYVIVLLLACSVVYGWFFKPKPQNVIYYTSPPVIRETVRIQKVYVPVGEGTANQGKVQVLDKQAVIKAIPTLPPDVKEDSRQQITSTATITPYEGKTNVVNVIDTSTGVSRMLAHQEKLPFMSIESDGEIGARIGYVAGVSSSPSMGGNVYVKYDFLRVGPIHTGGYAEAGYYPMRKDNQAEAKVMIQVSRRF